MNKPKAIIVDLDGTLCELNSPLDQYNHTIDDKPIQPLIDICSILISYSLDTVDELRVILLTGRKHNKYHDITIEWLMKHFNIIPHVIMQEGSTAQPNHIFKREALQKLQEEYNIIALIDDNPNLIPVCKDLKILLLQVHNGI